MDSKEVAKKVLKLSPRLIPKLRHIDDRMWLSGDYKDLPVIRQAITDIGFRHSTDRILLIDGCTYSWFHPCNEEQPNSSSPTTKPEETSTEFYQAVSDGDFELTKLKLKQGADPNWSNWPGVTPLLVAARAQRNDLIKLLMENGADPAISFDNRMDTQNMSAFELSRHLGNSAGAALISGQNIVDLHPEWPDAWKSLPMKDRVESIFQRNNIPIIILFSREIIRDGQIEKKLLAWSQAEGVSALQNFEFKGLITKKIEFHLLLKNKNKLTKTVSIKDIDPRTEVNLRPFLHEAAVRCLTGENTKNIDGFLDNPPDIFE